MKNHHETLCKVVKTLRSQANILYTLDRGFCLLCMYDLASKVRAVAQTLNEQADEIHNTSGKLIEDYFQQAQESSSNMLHGMLAVSNVAYKEQLKE